MASIGVVNADTPKTQDPVNTTDRPKKYYFGVFFDGTSNNMIQKEDAKKFKKNSSNSDDWESELISTEDESFKNGANQPYVENGKYSNVALLHSIYKGMSKETLEREKQDADVFIYNIYVEGAGTEAIYSAAWYEKTYNWKGSVSGKGVSGVAKLVAKAVNLIRTRLKGLSKNDIPNTEVHFDVFGFSRGATCARLFSYLAVRGSGDKLGCEEEFEDSVAKSYYSNNYLHFLDQLGLKSITVDFLGIYDTVSSIGGVTTESYANNVTDYGLFSPTLTDKVKSTYHLCAMDEYRSHFALTDIGSAASNANNAEILIPGCHSDVGGGYVSGEDNSFTLTKFAREPQINFAMDFVDQNSSVKQPLNKQTFEDLGWVGDDNGYEENLTHTTANIKRKVYGVYGNIPLEMMWKRTNGKNKRVTFNAIPLRYKTDERRFGEWSAQLLAYAEVGIHGRHCYYPGGSFSSDSYRRLRKNLHFSAKDSLGFDPSYDGLTFCRYLYHGNKGDNTRRFLYQINS